MLRKVLSKRSPYPYLRKDFFHIVLSYIEAYIISQKYLQHILLRSIKAYHNLYEFQMLYTLLEIDFKCVCRRSRDFYCLRHHIFWTFCIFNWHDNFLKGVCESRIRVGPIFFTCAWIIGYKLSFIPHYTPF